MAQRVRVTLRAKLLVLMLALILSSILGYLVLAVRLFDKDKKVDIYENNLFLVKSLASQIETGLAHNIRTLRLLATTAGTPTTDLAAIFHENDELVEVRVYLNKPEGTPLLHLRNDKYLEQYGLDAAYLESLSVKRPFPLERVREQKLWVQNASLPNGAPLLGVALALHSLAPGQPLLWVLAYVRQDQVLRLLSESPVYTMMLIDSYGKLLAHSDAQRAMQLEARADESVVSEILRDQKSGSGTREIASEKDASSQIFSHAKLGLGGLYLVSQISKDKAFLGSKLLMEKSFLVALLVILAASMGSILFSRSLTRALEKLYQATQRVAEGDLDQNVSVDSKDEIGSLARVFNRMIQEIKRLLAETADKARMEKELETARLVQDNLFP